MSGTFEIAFDYPRPPISGNSRMHWAQKAALTKSIRLASRLLASKIPHMNRIEVSLVWIVSDKRRRDGGENMAPTLKAMIDGLVDAGVLDDDDQAHVTRGPSTVEYIAKATPQMVLTVKEMTE